MSVDSRDHIWIIHRSSATLNNNERGAELNPPTGECCKGAPPVLEFDHDGNLVGSWGGPGQGYEWPESNHGITVDGKGMVWIGGNAANDGQVLKFTRPGSSSSSSALATQAPAATTPGHSARSPRSSWTNRTTRPTSRTATATTASSSSTPRAGKFKRYWGAYGNKPTTRTWDPITRARRRRSSSAIPCTALNSRRTNLVYVCDRVNDRIQVFTREGKFLKEQFIAKQSLADGSVWDIAFSKDPQQKYIFLADGRNQKVYIIERQSLEVLTSFGDGGRQPGQFFGVHSIATDSKGNIYTTETYEGKRLQKFVYKGIGPVTKENQGVIWPSSKGR